MGRRKTIQNDELLAVARAVFVEQGIAASTREIARRAGISEAVLYQRFPAKVELFFAAMVPPALDVEKLLAAGARRRSVPAHLEVIALGMLAYFRELVPILLPLVTHPSFNFEQFVHRHPESPLARLRESLVEYLESERARGRIADASPDAAALTLFATLHSLAFFERLGAHHGNFDAATVRAIVANLWTGLAPRKRTT